MNSRNDKLSYLYFRTKDIEKLGKNPMVMDTIPNCKLFRNPFIQCKNKENSKTCKTKENQQEINPHKYFDVINNKKLNKCNDNNYKSYDTNKYEFYKNCKPSEKCHKNESDKMKFVNSNKCIGLTQFLKLL